MNPQVTPCPALSVVLGARGALVWTATLLGERGGDPSAAMVEEYVSEEAVTISADDSIDEALRTMTEHGVRRLPVIYGHKLVGIVSQADVARNLSDDQIGQLVEAISNAPSN
jgi:CBS domain-containing protein